MHLRINRHFLRASKFKPVHCGKTTITDIVITYQRPTRKWGPKKKAVFAAAVTIAIWLAYNGLVMTDLKDTQPTVQLLTQGQP